MIIIQLLLVSLSLLVCGAIAADPVAPDTFNVVFNTTKGVLELAVTR